MSIVLYHNYDQYSLDLLLAKIKLSDYTDSFKYTYETHWPISRPIRRIPNKTYIIIEFTCKDMSIEKTIRELASGLKFRVTTLEAFELEKYINNVKYDFITALSVLPVIKKCQIPTANIKTFSKWYNNISEISEFNLSWCPFRNKFINKPEPEKEHLCRCPPGYNDPNGSSSCSYKYWCYYCNSDLHRFNAVLDEINVRRICQRPFKKDEYWYKLFLIMNSNLDVYYHIQNIYVKQGVHYHLTNKDKPHIIDNDGNFQLYRKGNQKSDRKYPIWPVRCGCCSKSKVIWIDR